MKSKAIPLAVANTPNEEELRAIARRRPPVRVILALAWLIAAVACGASPTAPTSSSGSFAFVDVSSGDVTGAAVAPQSFVAIRDQGTWQATWTSLGFSTAPPSVDFTHNMLILVSAAVPTAGYSIAVQTVYAEVEQGVIGVTALERVPAANCVVFQASSQVVDIVQVPATNGSVAGQVTTQTYTCG